MTCKCLSERPFNDHSSSEWTIPWKRGKATRTGQRRSGDSAAGRSMHRADSDFPSACHLLNFLQVSLQVKPFPNTFDGHKRSFVKCNYLHLRFLMKCRQAVAGNRAFGAIVYKHSKCCCTLRQLSQIMAELRKLQVAN